MSPRARTARTGLSLRFARWQPQGSPPLEVGHPLWGSIPSMRDRPLETLAALQRRHGPIFCLDMKVRPVYVLNDADAALQVLQDNAGNYVRGDSLASRRIRDWLGEGLLTTDGEAWSRLRRRQQPPFRQSRLTGAISAIVAATAERIDRWSGLARSGALLEAFPAFMSLTTSAGLRVLFGYAPAEDECAAIVQAVVSGQDQIWQSLFKLVDAARLLPTPSNVRSWRARSQLGRIADRILAGQPGDGGMLLDALRADPPMEREELRSQVRTMLVAAPENPSNALGFALALLEAHPEIERALLDEIEAVLGDGPPSAETLGRLQLTRRVIDETLRLYPGAWILERWSVADDEVCGYRLPGGRMVILCPYFIHRDPEHWPEPERFDPDRFLPERVAARPHHHYLPFGYGSRNCIGSRLALIELLVALPMLLRRYRFRMASPGPLSAFAQFTLRPHQLAFRLEERARSV